MCLVARRRHKTIGSLLASLPIIINMRKRTRFEGLAALDIDDDMERVNRYKSSCFGASSINYSRGTAVVRMYYMYVRFIWRQEHISERPFHILLQ